MTLPADGTVYLASDGQWYRWPDPTPYPSADAVPPAPPPPAPPPTWPGPAWPAPSGPAVALPGTATPPLFSAVGACQICGSAPAAHLELNRQTGMVIMFRTATLGWLVCGPCGIAVFRKAQWHNVLFGWWGLISFFFNWFVLARNALRIHAHQKETKGSVAHLAGAPTAYRPPPAPLPPAAWAGAVGLAGLVGVAGVNIAQRGGVDCDQLSERAAIAESRAAGLQSQARTIAESATTMTGEAKSAALTRAVATDQESRDGARSFTAMIVGAPDCFTAPEVRRAREIIAELDRADAGGAVD